MVTTTYAIRGMIGPDCVNSVGAELGRLPGVRDVRVELPAGTAVVTSSQPLDPAAVRDALDGAGYGLVDLKRSRGTSWRHFVRHFIEMVVAMVVGMAVLGPVVNLVFSLLGAADLMHRAELGALVMATNMTIGMSLWMRYRKHGWASIGEMGAAMYLPFVVLFVPFWAGLLSDSALMVGGHVLMLPAMLAAMLWRRDEYIQHHHHAHAATAPPVSANETA
jgi:copper chaperone CopZ